MNNNITAVPRTHTQARHSYDHMSHWYDWFAASERQFTEAGLRRLGPQPGEKILEIGCGTGHGLVWLAQVVGEKGRVYGLDLSPGMLEVARKRLQRNGLTGRVRLQQGDAVHLPYPTKKLEAIFMGFTLELFDTPEIAVVLGECRRTLRAGGRLCLVTLAKKETLGVRIYEWFHTLLPAVVDCRPIFAKLFVEKAGFEVLETVEKSMWGLPVEIVVARKP